MIQIIGLDLDGTLLNDQKAICDRNIEVLMKAKEKAATMSAVSPLHILTALVTATR